MLKLLVGCFLLIAVIVASTIVGTLFLYAGWNLGLVPAMPDVVHPVGLGTAFWLSMCLATIAGFFKTTVTSSKGRPE